jgi:hypothetical protein
VTAPTIEPRGRARRLLIEQARRLAVEGNWIEAVRVNQEILERSPKDADAYNRLGKAYFELRRFRSAYEAYQTASSLDPANMIALRNLNRLERLKDIEEEGYVPQPTPLRYGIFIEEVGKTYVDDLVNVAPSTVLIEISSGDRLDLRVEGQQVLAVTPDGQYVGQLEPRIARRMIELLELGNTYEVYVTSVAAQGADLGVRVIIREVSRSAAMSNRLSFPRQGKVAIPRAYLRDTRLFRGDEPELLLGDEEDDEVEGEDAEDFEATDLEEEAEYVEEAGTVATEDEEDEAI